MVIGRRVIDGPDRSRLLIDVPTGILIDRRSKDITSAIGLVSSPTFTGTLLSSFLILLCPAPSPASSIMRLVLRVSVPFVPLEVVAVITPCLTMFKAELLVVRRPVGR